MGIEFEARFGRPVLGRSLRAAAFALGGAGLVAGMMLRASEPGALAAIAAVGAALAVAGLRFGSAGACGGSLRVDAQGHARFAPAAAAEAARARAGDDRGLTEGGESQGRGADPVPVFVERWFEAAGFVWLRLREASGPRRWDLMSGRGAFGDHGWHRLRAWLAWLERGGERQ